MRRISSEQAKGFVIYVAGVFPFCGITIISDNGAQLYFGLTEAATVSANPHTL